MCAFIYGYVYCCKVYCRLNKHMEEKILQISNYLQKFLEKTSPVESLKTLKSKRKKIQL